MMINVYRAPELKAFSASILIHLIFGGCLSLLWYSQAPSTLELTGKAGGKLISLGQLSVVKKSEGRGTPKVSSLQRGQTQFQASTEQTAAVSREGAKDEKAMPQETSSGPFSSGEGQVSSGFSFGSGAGDFDGGVLFSQIKKHFEVRLGNKIEINEDQLIKVKILLERDGSIRGAELVEGRVPLLIQRKILSVARSIPIKTLWKTSMPFPGELIIPLFLTSES